MINSSGYVAGPLAGLTFQFQPILAADGRRLLAYETLARRSLRDGTIEGPAKILPAAVQPARIEEFTRLTLDFALARLSADPFLPGLSVNLSPRQAELAVTAGVISRSAPDVRRRLILEVTEDPIADHPALARVLSGLASLGVRILLDDVGSGWPERCHALCQAVHGLKIDRSMLMALVAHRAGDEAQQLLQFAAENSLLVIAEGIEDVDLLPRLAARGVSFFQGFALGEPWSEPRIARRRIVPPRVLVPVAGSDGIATTMTTFKVG